MFSTVSKSGLSRIRGAKSKAAPWTLGRRGSENEMYRKRILISFDFALFLRIMVSKPEGQ